MGLEREDLVALAYFLGSDYCEGVHGVGIVNALEILQAFPMKQSAGEGEGEVWGTEVVGCNYFQSIESGRQGQQQVRQCSSAAFAACSSSARRASFRASASACCPQASNDGTAGDF